MKTFVVSITYQMVRFSHETLILFIFCFVLFFSNEARIFVSLQTDFCNTQRSLLPILLLWGDK